MIVFSVALIIVMLVIDQLTKLMVIDKIQIGEVISVIKFGEIKLFSLTHVRNKGAAWSSFSSKTTLLTIFTIILAAGLLLLIFNKTLQKKLFDRDMKRLETTACSLVVAGGLGNLIDRIRLKEVVDFIKTDFIDFPVFNFADICVVCGCILLMICVLISDISEAKRKKSTEITDE